MKPLRILGLISALFLFSFAQCDEERNDSPSTVEKAAAIDTVQPGMDQVSASYQDFGLALFRRLSNAAPQENIFISPASIAAALSMTMNGAAGQTLEEMRETLGGQPLAGVNAANKAFLEALPEMDSSVQAVMANSIWYREGFAVEDEFINTTEEYYKSEVQALDFSDPAAPARINNWVADKTQGKIEEIIDRIDPMDRMFLINAIYFNGDWQFPFDEDRTAPAPFYLAGNGSVQVDMMRLNTLPLPYYATSQAHLIDLPYGDGEAFSMTILLPKEGASVAQLLDSLNDQSWRAWAGKLSARQIDFAMPKFEMRYQTSLNEPLKEMGMPRAFDPQEADFSNISTAEQLFISAVRHKAFVNVDEQGTEAAAVTGVGVTTTAAIEPLRITVDRPFLFVIRERETGRMLFMGKVMNPGEE